MTCALVLMKAMPPTKGHERLLDFARRISPRGVVMIDTAPDEPLVEERCAWIRKQIQEPVFGWHVSHISADDQDSDSEGFWERWTQRWNMEGSFDYVIGSEPYCAKVAECIGARYIPYDPGRELEGARATDVRQHPQMFFNEIALGFQHHMKTTITVFGGESTGKTTLSKRLSDLYPSLYEWVFEWARPYLEGTGQTVADLQAMYDIWHGQRAVEENADKFAVDKPFIIRDTDLYSTIGYWEQPHWENELGEPPLGLLVDAAKHKADLYIITPSNIPFEKDPLRYGGDHRESPDEYWISVAEKYNLPYVVLTSNTLDDRLLEATYRADHAFKVKNRKLTRAVRV